MTKRRTKSLLLALLMGITAVFFPSCSKEEAYRLVKINSYDGEVSVQREEKLNAFEGLQLVSEDSVTVGDKSFLELLADSDKHIAAEENTGFVLHSTGDENSGDITIDLLYGRSLFTIDNKLTEGSTFAVNTPNATLSVRGTSFSVAYDEETKTTDVEVYSGTVQLNSGDEEMLIKKDGTASIISTDEGVKIITNSTAGNPNAIAVPENTEKLFEIAMTYPQQEGYNATNAEYRTIVSEYTAKETGIGDNDIVFQKFIGLIKNHNEEISKFFEENKAKAIANTNKLLDVTDWFKEKIAVGDKEFRIDKAIMDMSIYGSNIERKYITSDTYKVNTEGMDMYFCANGVEISFYGGFEKAAVVTTTTTTTTVPETTAPETTAVETTTTTAATTTAPVTTTTTKVTTTSKKEEKPSESREWILLSVVYHIIDGTPELDYFTQSFSKANGAHCFKYENGKIDLYGYTNDEKLDPGMEKICLDHVKHCDDVVAIYNKIKKNNFKEVIKERDEYNSIDNKRLDIDVSDWFDDEYTFEIENKIYKFYVDRIEPEIFITFRTLPGMNEILGYSDDVAVDPDTGEKFYTDGFMLFFHFYGNYDLQ